MDFRIRGLDPAPFRSYFELSEDELARRGARRSIVTASPGTPCRVSLEDAPVGEEVVLLHYAHHTTESSPCRAAGPIFVRKAAGRAFDAVNEVPELFRTRLLSVRAYDDAGFMVAADVVEGTVLEGTIDKLLGKTSTAFLHVHYARPGCFACRVERA
ncbi:MAG: DUF1203 domain-containing protein [Acidobacteria bacterium]|nr:DUF1203 domain-containing protein [Acidobacteriota bacterium]